MELIARLTTLTAQAELIASIEEAAQVRESALMGPLDRLVDRPEPAVALAALRALLIVAGDQREALAARLDAIGGDHHSADVRFMARRALAELRTTPPQQWPLKRLKVEEVVARLSAPQPEMRLILLDRVIAQRDPVLGDPIAGALALEKDPRVLARMITVLRELGIPEHVVAIRPLLSHEDDRVCANAIEAVVHLSGDDHVASLMPLLAREDNRLRANLVVALRTRFPEQVAGYVRRMLRDARFSYRVSAVYCARFLDHADLHADVKALCDDEHPLVARAALDWTTEFGPRPPDPAPVATRSRPVSRPITRPDRTPPRATGSRLGDPRTALAAAALVVALLGASIAWRVNSQDRADREERDRLRAVAAARGGASIVAAQVVGVSGTDVEVLAHGIAYTIRWDAKHGPLPRAGTVLKLRGPTMARQPDGAYRVSVEAVTGP